MTPELNKILKDRFLEFTMVSLIEVEIPSSSLDILLENVPVVWVLGTLFFSQTDLVFIKILWEPSFIDLPVLQQQNVSFQEIFTFLI